jgi:ABC-type transporter Mla maintaining outer membrane lipid asymmetry ATPase subunit MlaF
VTTFPAFHGPVVEITGISKDYQGLRPLRIEKLAVARAEHVAILGLDQPMGETLVNLVTGALLPDRGDVTIFGASTAAIGNGDEWLSIVDRFGIISGRAVLLDSLTVAQNLSMPFTLEIDPPPENVQRSAASLAAEAGLSDVDRTRLVSEFDAAGRLRIRLARALALDPEVLLVEHASAGLPADAAAEIGRDIRQVASRRQCALIAVTADTAFAKAVATRVLTLDPGTGRLSEGRRNWSLFQRGD